MFSETEAVTALETNIWSMMAQFGRVDPGRLIETPTRLVLETDVAKPPYNTVLRFYDEGNRSIDAQVHELVARFERRACTPAWLVHPTTPRGVRESLEAHGWVCAETMPGMIHTLDDLAPVPDMRSDIEVVEAGVGHGAAWLDLVSTRHGRTRVDRIPRRRARFQARHPHGQRRRWHLWRCHNRARSRQGSRNLAGERRPSCDGRRRLQGKRAPFDPDGSLDVPTVGVPRRRHLRVVGATQRSPSLGGGTIDDRRAATRRRQLVPS